MLPLPPEYPDQHGAGKTWEVNQVGGDGVTLHNNDGWFPGGCSDARGFSVNYLMSEFSRYVNPAFKFG